MILLLQSRVVVALLCNSMSNNNFIFSFAGRVQRFKMLEIIWVKLEIAFNVLVSSAILFLHFTS